MAIRAAPEGKLSLNDIYTWISDTFPYYSRAGRGWKVGSEQKYISTFALKSKLTKKGFITKEVSLSVSEWLKHQ